MYYITHVFKRDNLLHHSEVRLANGYEDCLSPAVLAPIMYHCIDWEYTSDRDWMIIGHNTRYVGSVVTNFETGTSFVQDLFDAALRQLQNNLNNGKIEV